MCAAEGDYVEIEGDDGIKEKCKNRPQDLANLLKNGRRFTCPVRGKEMIWVPKYHMKVTNEDTEIEERKRKFTSHVDNKKDNTQKP